MNELSVTWTTKYLCPTSGRECTIGISNGDGKAVLAKASEIMNWLGQIGAQPVLTPTAIASANATDSAPMLELVENQTRHLITRVKKTGPTKADLFARGRKYRETILFDIGELFAVGIDPRNLPEGVETPCRFYAILEESEKLNGEGNPYFDCVRLERAQ